MKRSCEKGVEIKDKRKSRDSAVIYKIDKLNGKYIYGTNMNMVINETKFHFLAPKLDWIKFIRVI